MSGAASGLLRGIRVVEFVHMVMGPSAGLILADLGADVIKVEPTPDGDNTRRLGGSGSGFFAMVNRNKRSLAVDLKTPEGKKLLELTEALNKLGAFVDTFMISALKSLGLKHLLSALAARMPAGPWLYPEDQVMDAPLRSLAAEITREKILERLHDELPYDITVETDQWKQLPDGSARIEQTIFVARESQKKIVIGEGGRMLKSIGASARRDIGEAAETTAHLFLFVKVRENWADDPERYRAMGLEFPRE